MKSSGPVFRTFVDISLQKALSVGWDALRPSILAVEILRYSFDLDGFVDGCSGP